MPGQHPSELAQQADVDRLEGQLAEQDSLLNQRGVLIRELQGKVAALEAGRLLAVQRKHGLNEAYTVNVGGAQDIIDGGGGHMRFDYTPPVNAWWEVTGQLGLMQKVDAAYHYLSMGLALLPGDADGVISATTHYITQHATVQQFEGYSFTRIFKLNAGVAYSIRMYMSPSGGTWRYFTGVNQLWMDGKVWAR